MAHVPLRGTEGGGIVARLARAYTRRRFGRMVEPTAAARPITPGVLIAMGGMETAAQLGWRKLDPRLRWLAIQVDEHAPSGARGASTTATTRACTTGSTRPRSGQSGDWRSSDLFDEP